MLREYKQFLKKIHQIVHDQMKIGHVNCDTVSEALSMTNQHLRRKIFSITGITGAVDILGIRMAYTQQLLESAREYPIATVARKCGHEDSNNFSRTFKRDTGLSPSEFRRQSNRSKAT